MARTATRRGTTPTKGKRTARPASSTFTSVPVKPETLRRLRSYKVGGKTYDDVLNAFMDETPTEAFWKEMELRLKEEPRLTWDRKLGKFV